MKSLSFITILNLSWIALIILLYFLGKHFEKKKKSRMVLMLKILYWVLAVVFVALTVINYFN